MLAYLVIREGAKWTDVFRLIPGQTTTIGRAPTNQIVIKDDRCSRYHAEIFQSEGQWKVRDLDSRNGTTLGNQAIHGEFTLSPGDVIRIGRSQLAFVHDLSKAFPDSSSLIVKEFRPDYQAPESGFEETQANPGDEPTHVIAKCEQSLLDFSEDAPVPEILPPKYLLALGRLGFLLAEATDEQSLLDHTLDYLLSSLQISTGGILLFPGDAQSEVAEHDLEVFASRSQEETPYQRVPAVLSVPALSERQGLLTVHPENAVPSAALFSSTICAPLRRGSQVLGLLHLTSRTSERRLDEGDLLFALSVADWLALALERLGQQSDLSRQLTLSRDENRQLRAELGVESELLGQSFALARVSEQITKAAESKDPVLIQGEMGVGKDVVARAIHFSSVRSQQPFVVVHCGLEEEDTLDRILFGQASDGQRERIRGKLEAADRGSLLLEQIDTLSHDQQTQLLRFIEGQGFQPLGGTNTIKPDVRILASSEQDLEREVKEGRFRQDLLFRLQARSILIPALHRRSEDIPALANHFLHFYNQQVGKRVAGISAEAMEKLVAYRWPGNVRELKNVIERAVMLSHGEELTAEDVFLPSPELNTAS